MSKQKLKTCIETILPSLTAVVEGQSVYPKELSFKDGTGWKFCCPYCSSRKQKPSKKKELVARIYPVPFSYKFSCPKCPQSMSIQKFLEDQFPLVYEAYQRDKAKDSREKSVAKQDFQPRFPRD